MGLHYLQRLVKEGTRAGRDKSSPQGLTISWDADSGGTLMWMRLDFSEI